MLGLKESKDNSFCDYEPRTVVTKQKKIKSDVKKKENLEHVLFTVRKNANLEPENLMLPESEFKTQASNITVQTQHYKSENLKEDEIKDDNISWFDSPEQNGENSKALMESIGSWINDLFNASNKTATESENSKGECAQESISEEDMEYYKSINVIKEQFKKKLKNETTVHLSSSEKPFELNFDKVLDNGRKHKRKSKAPVSMNQSQWLEELNQLDDEVVEANDPLIRRYYQNPLTTELVIRSGEEESLMKSLNSNPSMDSNGLILKSERRNRNRHRCELDALEQGYDFPTPAELSKKILLYISDQDKRTQFYKSSHLGVQESQHYGQGKKKAYQTNARCYTTNANLNENVENLPSKTFSNPSRSSHYCATDAAYARGASEILSKNGLDMKKNQAKRSSKKVVTDFTKESVSLLKMKSPKFLANISSEPPAKAEVKPTSNDLVKYLMKKIKINHRPQLPKKKETVSSVASTEALINPKNRFLQSATNTLVMSVMAKNDTQTPGKTRSSSETRLHPLKELSLKYPENNIRCDVSRAINSNKFRKCSYLHEDDKIENDAYLIDRSHYKNARRPSENAQKQDGKLQSSKLSKREEVRNAILKLNNYDFYQASKAKQKERRKKPIQNLFEDYENANVQKEDQNARYQKQHELFKTTPKPNDQILCTNLNSDSNSMPNVSCEEKENEKPIDTSDVRLLPAKLTVDDANSQVATQVLQVKDEIEVLGPSKLIDLTPANPLPPPPLPPPPSTPALPSTREPDDKAVEYLPLSTSKPEKKLQEKANIYKEKYNKNKHFSKENEGRVMISPLEEFYHSENQNQIQKDNPPNFENSACQPVRSPKSSETSLLNRRYSTKILNETNQNSVVLSRKPSNKLSLYLAEPAKEGEKNVKENKEKKKGKTSKVTGSREANLENACGFEKVRKPGPNCEKEH